MRVGVVGDYKDKSRPITVILLARSHLDTMNCMTSCFIFSIGYSDEWIDARMKATLCDHQKSIIAAMINYSIIVLMGVWSLPAMHYVTQYNDWDGLKDENVGALKCCVSLHTALARQL